MKAIVYSEYGSPDVLHIEEMAKPTPKDNEILIRVRATTVGFGDLMARRFGQISPREFNMLFLFWLGARFAFGLNKPKRRILGSEFAGEVEAVGSAVTRFKPGDAVFGYRGENLGAYAEYLCVAEDGPVALKPANLSFEEAAAVPYGALTALTLLKKTPIERGQKVLVNGASGGIGSYAAQLARYYGAVVTGVCGTPRMDYVKSLGSERVIDYTREDFTQSGETYDLIVDVLGRSSFSRCARVLRENGRYLRVSFKMPQLLQMLWTSLRGGKRVICTLSGGSQQDLMVIKELVETGQLKSILDRCFPMEQAADAHRYVEAGNRHGPVVITVA